MRKLAGTAVALVLVTAACGDDGGVGGLDLGVSEEEMQDAAAAVGTEDPGPASVGSNSADDPIPEASGPLGANSIRIGDEVWNRTLPMTTGQCFLYQDDGTLPDSGTAWGTLDGDDSLRFSANYNQDGTFEAEVQGDTMFWVAGDRAGTDLTVRLDFATNTITGEGVFSNLMRAEYAEGSFTFTCEDEG